MLKPPRVARGLPVEPASRREDWLTSRDALFVVRVLDGPRFVYEDLNPAAQRHCGFTNAEAVGREPHELFPQAVADEILGLYGKCARAGRPVSFQQVLPFPVAPTEWRTRLTPQLSASGEVVRLMGCSQRIHRAQVAEVEFQKVLDAMTSGIGLLDGEGVILSVNAAWNLFGAGHEAPTVGVGDNYIAGCEQGCAGLPGGAEVIAQLRALLRGETQTLTHRYGWMDRHLVLRVSRFSLSGATRFVAAHQDFTDVVAAQQTLAHAAEQLVLVQEAERARIAVELHDSTSQHLVALGLGLARLQRGNASAEVMDDMRHSLAEAHKEIRALSYILYPPKLGSQGLMASLRSFVEGYRRRTGLCVAVSHSGPIDDTPLAVQHAIFRVVQEALANVHRHADGRRVSVDLTLKRRGLRVVVADDGRGVTTEALQAPDIGIGIRGMQARLSQFGGELTVTDAPFGAVVDGFIPAAGLRRAAELGWTPEAARASEGR